MGGRIVPYTDSRGRPGHDWVDAEEVLAMACDMPVVGYGAKTVNNLCACGQQNLHAILIYATSMKATISKR